MFYFIFILTDLAKINEKKGEIEINVFSEMMYLEKCSLDDVRLVIRKPTSLWGL